MQKIAAYLLERKEGMNWPQARAQEATRIRQAVSKWLVSKGAAAVAPNGTYEAEDGSKATFSIDEAAVDGRDWWMVRLEEVTDKGRRFVTAISVTNAADRVAVYATLEAGSHATIVNRVDADPRCPKALRSLLELEGAWFHGNTKLNALRFVSGFDAAQGLVAELKSPQRTVPVIVVSDADGIALPDLNKCLAYDMVGIANVVVVDIEASWALTDELGKDLSCYSGAVRVYWPRLSLNDDPLRHPLWTKQRLGAAGGDATATRERFRRQLRELVMRAAALGVVRPKEIDEIRTAASNMAFAELKAKAKSLEDHAQLADLYAADNQALRDSAAAMQKQVDALEERIVELEGERAALLVRVENAEVQLKYREEQTNDIPPDPIPAAEPTSVEPKDGEVRFYKKVHSAPSHDLMERVGDCGCDNWQGSHAADKARKGIARLENGRTDWKKMQHCASCTGGGLWRVKW